MTHRLLRLVLPELMWNQEIYGAWLQRFVSKDVRWLEAGCGRRILGEDLENVEDSLVAAVGMVVGTDLTIDSLAQHRNIERRTCASIDSLPFADNSFDLVTCNMVIEHLPNPLAAFREITRVLSPSGVLILHTPNTLNYVIFLNRTVARVLPRRFVLWVIRATEDRQESDIFPTFYRANSLKRLREISRELNLIEVSSRVLTAPQPVCRFFAPLAFFELLLMRATMSRPCGRFGTTLLAAFRKAAADESSAAQASYD